MRVLIQRVKKAKVTVNDEITGEIDKGLLVFLGVGHGDTREECDYLIKKITQLRIFPDEKGKMNLSLLDTEGDLLVVSQFTLYGDCRRGRRPSFTDSADPRAAEELYEYFSKKSASVIGHPVQTGRFAAEMDVDLINWGPVTFWLETPQREVP